MSTPSTRKLKTARKRPIYLDTAEQIAAILDAATDLDARKEARTAGRRGFVATLTFAGLRIHEAAALTWRDVDLARGRITVGRSKTDAGIRTVDIVPVLQDELTAHRSTSGAHRSRRLRLPDLHRQQARQGQRTHAGRESGGQTRR